MPTHQTTTNNEREQGKNAHYTQTQCQHTKLPPIPNADREKMCTTHIHIVNTPNYHQCRTLTGKKCALHTNTMRTHQTITNTERGQGKNARPHIHIVNTSNYHKHWKLTTLQWFIRIFVPLNSRTGRRRDIWQKNSNVVWCSRTYHGGSLRLGSTAALTGGFLFIFFTLRAVVYPS